MFARCRRIINPAASKLKITSGQESLKKSAERGKLKPARSEARETIRKIINAQNQTRTTIPKIWAKKGTRKDKPINTPKEVATPLPPLKLRNTLQLWPQIQLKPRTNLKVSGEKKALLVRI